MSRSGHCVRSTSAVCLAGSAAAATVPPPKIAAPRKAAKAPEGNALPGGMVRPLQPGGCSLLQSGMPLTPVFSEAFQQLAMNAWCAPQRVVAADCPDQIADIGQDRRPA